VLSHEKVWAAIDALAAQNGLSPSGLARRAGLDPTSFNPSKRFAGDGRPRWPSTESLAKILDATGEALDVFAARVEIPAPSDTDAASLVPLIGLQDTAELGIFDGGGRPAGASWTTFRFPALGDGEFALRVSDDAFFPLYRQGDIVIVSHAAKIRRGDRLVVKPAGKPLTLCFLQNETAAFLEVATIGDKSRSLHFQPSAIEWRARIIWASQ